MKKTKTETNCKRSRQMLSWQSLRRKSMEYINKVELTMRIYGRWARLGEKFPDAEPFCLRPSTRHRDFCSIGPLVQGMCFPWFEVFVGESKERHAVIEQMLM